LSTSQEVVSGKTAIHRQELSAPAEWLFQEGLLEGRILDFGCGHGDLARFLEGDIEQYDPNWFPEKPEGKFDVVVCIYVLNTLRTRARRKALREAKSYVRHGGVLYVAVRRDVLIEGPRNGGTEQYQVDLRMKSLVRKPVRFEIYEWRNE